MFQHAVRSHRLEVAARSGQSDPSNASCYDRYDGCLDFYRRAATNHPV